MSKSGPSVRRLKQLKTWWARGLLKRVPVLENGDGTERSAILYGAASNYGENLQPRVSAGEFYDFFRFARCDIPRLVEALRIPEDFKLPNRCRIDGEEALLIYLHCLPYPDRLVGMQRFFGRSVGYISGVCTAVREHLKPILKSRASTG
ncbi:hypothetical protein M885DRAFT_563906 [Pelagophyceae sp. CCMP2097]|nr:hypothetical protein M885DRAFT_563906 [Pelagophyceae sp. CCMP2097]